MHSTVFDWKGGGIEVEALRLDDYLEKRFKDVDLVKIDVEGAEPMVLEGMKRAIESHPGIRLVVEFAPERVAAAGHQPRKYLEDLIEQGFLIHIIDEGERRVVPTNPAEILARFEGDKNLNYTNLFLQRSTGMEPGLKHLAEKDTRHGDQHQPRRIGRHHGLDETPPETPVE